MSATSTKEIWFLTGSQELYGQETLDKVAEHSREIAAHLDDDTAGPGGVQADAHGAGGHLADVPGGQRGRRRASASSPGCTPSRPRRCG